MDILILDWISTYGTPLITLLILLGAAGVPLPTSLVVVFSGALIRQDALEPGHILPLAMAGAVVGDMISYGIGRMARPWAEKHYGASAAWQKAQQFLARRGGLAVYLTRWLITSLGIATSVLAGSSRYPFRKFILFDIAGELTWMLLYGALGYLFSSQWETVSSLLSQLTGISAAALALAVGVVLLVRYLPPYIEAKRALALARIE